ncbi:MAG TPA: hypothetical protein VHX12_07330 [Acidisoma sp.]|nr:hypothetical protein [Acidisoma sp.]
MRVLFFTTLIGALGACAVASAQPSPRDSAVLCLDGLGVNHPATCNSQSASRLDTKPDICICQGPYREVRTNWCARGEHPPADSADYDRARVAAVHDGNIFGFSYQGKRDCVPQGPNGD